MTGYIPTEIDLGQFKRVGKDAAANFRQLVSDVWPHLSSAMEKHDLIWDRLAEQVEHAAIEDFQIVGRAKDAERREVMPEMEPEGFSEAMTVLESADRSLVMLRPKLARAILAAIAQRDRVIEISQRTSNQRRLAFEAALGAGKKEGG